MSWGLVIGAVGTAAGGYLSSQGAKSAADASVAGSNAAIAEQQRQFDLTRSDTAPYRNIGGQALSALGSIYGYDANRSATPLSFAEWSAQQPQQAAQAKKKKHHGLLGGLLNPLNLLDPAGGTVRAIKGQPTTARSLLDPGGLTGGGSGSGGTTGGGDLQAQYQQYLAGFQPPANTATAPDYSQFYQSPDYQFRRTEGNRDIGNSFAARGGAASGNALKALTEYNSNLAAGEFGNYFQRQAQLAGIGANGVNTATNAGVQTASNIGNALINQGNVRASGLQGQYDAWGNALNQVGGVLGDWLQRRRQPTGSFQGW